MKKAVLIFLMLCFFPVVATCDATTGQYGEEPYGIKMPDGNFISLEGLTPEEQTSVIKQSNKIKEQYNLRKNAVNALVDKDVPTAEGLEKWRVLITKTIRDVATDLNVAVNEFIKTPAGIITVSLVVYKVAKETIEGIASTVFDVIISIPLWITIMIIIWRLNIKYLSEVTMYDDKFEDANGKITYSNPRRVQSYEFKDKETKFIFTMVLFLLGIVSTAVMMLLVFM